MRQGGRLRAIARGISMWSGQFFAGGGACAGWAARCVRTAPPACGLAGRPEAGWLPDCNGWAIGPWRGEDGMCSKSREWLCGPLMGCGRPGPGDVLVARFSGAVESGTLRAGSRSPFSPCAMRSTTPLSEALPLAIAALGAVLHLGLLLQVLTLKSFAGWLFSIAVLAPWLLFLVAYRLGAGRSSTRRLSLSSGVSYLVFGTWAFFDTIYVHPDAQGGLVFLVIPLAASMGAVVLVFALLLTRQGSAAGPSGAR